MPKLRPPADDPLLRELRHEEWMCRELKARKLGIEDELERKPRPVPASLPKSIMSMLLDGE